MTHRVLNPAEKDKFFILFPIRRNRVTRDVIPSMKNCWSRGVHLHASFSAVLPQPKSRTYLKPVNLKSPQPPFTKGGRAGDFHGSRATDPSWKIPKNLSINSTSENFLQAMIRLGLLVTARRLAVHLFFKDPHCQEETDNG
jgi:hypothetical protein